MRRIFKRRIALLGGAFDPPHRGHLALAKRAVRDLPVAVVRIVPNGMPPHRPPTKYSWRERVDLCARATAGMPRTVIGREESPDKIRRTIDTVRRHRQRRRHIILVMGADAFAGFHCWRGWRRLLKTANIAVARRNSGGTPHAMVRASVKTVKNARLLADGAGRVFLWHFRPGDISSTAIRAARK